MIWGLWDRETVAAILFAAYLPLAAFWLAYDGPGAAQRLGLALLVVALWHLIFMLARAQPPSLAGGTTALAIAILAPENLGTFQLVLGVSFGAVVGELIFGGWGRNVVNPATLALSFLGFGFPGLAWPEIVAPILWAAIPAAVIGLGFGVLSAGVLVGGTILLAAAGWTGMASVPTMQSAGLVLVLLVADPVTCAATRLGRWLNGALYAGLIMLFATLWGGAAVVQIAVAAALLTSLSVPLLDEVALALWLSQRRRRHGPN